MSPSESARAGPFQVGLLCPACQKALGTGDEFVSCEACSAVHHASCWSHQGACASYHCDTRTSASPTAPAALDVIRVTADEVARAPTPTAREPMTRAEGPRTMRPLARSKAAIVGVGVSTLALGLAALGALRGDTLSPLVALTIFASLVLSFGGGILASLALGTIFTERRRRGAPLALLGLCGALAAAGLDVYSLATGAPGGGGPGGGLSLSAPEPPSAEMFASAPAPIANAMHANVFIAGDGAGMSWCGAGVVLGRDGDDVLILTNRHVAAPNELSGAALRVTFSSGEVAPARVEWTAGDGVDLAVISTRPRQPPTVVTRLRAAGAQISEHVFALGNPLSLSWTYTEGAVSRVHTNRTGGTPVEIIQTQTPLQHGNSGGGLYDLKGRLMGINTWAALPAEGQGPGFAISVRTIGALVPSRFLAMTTADEGSGE